MNATQAKPVVPSGICDCGRRAYKKFHGRDWVCARCEAIEIAFNKRRKAEPDRRELRELTRI